MSAEMSMRCEDVAPYLSAFADGELPDPLRSEVAEHVATCDACSATLARYTEIDALLADLPRSAPSPELLDEILAVVAAEDEQAERRRAIRSSWGLSSIKTKLINLETPRTEWSSPRHLRPTRRSRWVSVALPAIAALLLISVTLVTFRWLPSKGITLQSTSQPTATPAPGSQTVADTQSAVSAIAAQFSFKPVLPSYLPDGVKVAGVDIGPRNRDTEISDHVLDVYWKVTSTGALIHLHEAPTHIGLPDYSAATASSPVAWQIGHAPWLFMKRNDAPKDLAIGQVRSGVTIALDISAPANSPRSAASQTMLRLISLSMDSPYKAIPVAPDESSARILPVPIQQMVAHYTAVAQNGNGGVAWREDVYMGPCTSTADPCQVSTTYSLGSDGVTLYTDIANGQRLLHLDKVLQTYSWRALIPSEQVPNLNSTGLPKLFYLANTYLSTGILWNMGETTYKGQRVYNLLWTNAPTPTHVYVNMATRQVVAMVVDSHANIEKGGPIAGTGALSCLRYTMIEYLMPDASTDAKLAQTIPPNYSESQSLDSQLSLTC